MAIGLEVNQNWMFDIHIVVHGTTGCNHYNLTSTDFFEVLDRFRK